MEKIDQLAGRPLLIAGAYLAYLFALTCWREIFPMQIVGVCLSLLLIYTLGVKLGLHGRLPARILLLGKYSLLAYLAQIAVLLALFAVLRRLGLGWGTLVVSGVAAFVLTWLVVEVVDFARRRSKTVNWLYAAVFL